MTPALHIAPVALHAPAVAGPQTFAGEADRARLTPAALTGYRGVADAWGLPAGTAAALLGVSASTWERMRRGTRARADTMSQDPLTRVSALVGIYKGLRLLFADDMATRWPRLPNANPLFGGATPVDAMLAGGIPHMLETRRLIDAVRGGL